MQMFVAHTFEIDDSKDAVQDIMDALPLAELQGKSVMGFMTTHADAIESGVVAAICAALPFDIIGKTCFASCGHGEADIALLTLTVLASDTLRFATAVSRPLGHDYQDALGDACAQIQEKLGESPALTIMCAPFSRTINGQDITSHLSTLWENTPIFGGLAADHTSEPEGAYVIYNGQHESESVALLCMAGPVKARFAFTSLRPDTLQRHKAIITASEGNTVFAVNDMPVMNYVYSLGLSSDELQGAGSVIPFLVDYNDGTALVAREVLSVTPEKHLQFGANMPVGSSIYLALQTPEEVLNTAEELLYEIEKHKEHIAGILVVGCAGRSVILGGEPLAEASKALLILDKSLSYHQVYSRGEVCPVYLPSGKIENRFHNFTFSVCMFEKT